MLIATLGLSGHNNGYWATVAVICNILNQLVKGCEIVMLSTILLASENEQLHIENQCQKRKRVKKHSFIGREGVLSRAEGASRTQAS
jgi:hypothetical protein